MLAVTYPLQVLLMTFSGLVNRHQADVTVYLAEENRVLGNTGKVVVYVLQIGKAGTTARRTSSANLPWRVSVTRVHWCCKRQERGIEPSYTELSSRLRNQHRTPPPMAEGAHTRRACGSSRGFLDRNSRGP